MIMPTPTCTVAHKRETIGLREFILQSVDICGGCKYMYLLKSCDCELVE